MINLEVYKNCEIRRNKLCEEKLYVCVLTVIYKRQNKDNDACKQIKQKISTL